MSGMDQRKFERLAEDVACLYWWPLVTELRQKDARDKMHAPDKNHAPDGKGKRLRPLGREVTPYDVITWLLDRVDPALRDILISTLVLRVEARNDSRVLLWWDALRLTHDRLTDCGDAVPEPLGDMVSGTLARERRGETVLPQNRSQADDSSAVRRLLSHGVYIVVRQVDLPATRGRYKKGLPHCPRDEGVAEGGSACDVVAKASGFTYAQVERAWSEARKRKWVIGDGGRPSLPDRSEPVERELMALLRSNLLPWGQGRPPDVWNLDEIRAVSAQLVMQALIDDLPDTSIDAMKFYLTHVRRSLTPRKKVSAHIRQVALRALKRLLVPTLRHFSGGVAAAPSRRPLPAVGK